jgi:hypothetical protein
MKTSKAAITDGTKLVGEARQAIADLATLYHALETNPSVFPALAAQVVSAQKGNDSVMAKVIELRIMSEGVESDERKVA